MICAFSRFLFCFPVEDKGLKKVVQAVQVVLQLFPQIRKIRGDNAFDGVAMKELPVTLEFGAALNPGRILDLPI